MIEQFGEGVASRQPTIDVGCAAFQNALHSLTTGTLELASRQVSTDEPVEEIIRKLRSLPLNEHRPAALIPLIIAYTTTINQLVEAASTLSVFTSTAAEPRTTKVVKRTWYGGKKVVEVPAPNNEPPTYDDQDEEKGGVDLESGGWADEVDSASPSKRPVKLYAPIYNGIAAGLALVFIGNGIRTLLMEWRLDGNAIRFALLACAPLLYCVSLFFALQIVQNVSMAYVPPPFFPSFPSFPSLPPPSFLPSSPSSTSLACSVSDPLRSQVLRRTRHMGRSPRHIRQLRRGPYAVTSIPAAAWFVIVKLGSRRLATAIHGGCRMSDGVWTCWTVTERQIQRRRTAASWRELEGVVSFVVRRSSFIVLQLPSFPHLLLLPFYKLSKNFRNVKLTPNPSHLAITTVGYGEITPRSFLGRLVTLPILVFGLLLITLPSFVLGREFSLVWGVMTAEVKQSGSREELSQEPESEGLLPSVRRRSEEGGTPGEGIDELEAGEGVEGSAYPPPPHSPRLRLRPHPSAPDASSYDPFLSQPVSASRDLSNMKLAQNQTELSRQIEELRAVVERQGRLLEGLVEVLRERTTIEVPRHPYPRVYVLRESMVRRSATRYASCGTQRRAAERKGGRMNIPYPGTTEYEREYEYDFRFQYSDVILKVIRTSARQRLEAVSGIRVGFRSGQFRGDVSVLEDATRIRTFQVILRTLSSHICSPDLTNKATHHLFASTTLAFVFAFLPAFTMAQNCQRACCDVLVKGVDGSNVGINCHEGGMDCRFSLQVTACCERIVRTLFIPPCIPKPFILQNPSQERKFLALVIMKEMHPLAFIGILIAVAIALMLLVGVPLGLCRTYQERRRRAQTFRPSIVIVVTSGTPDRRSDVSSTETQVEEGTLPLYQGKEASPPAYGESLACPSLSYQPL
ncbi:hypothetical protein NMY22_g5926 [Coprinellus aureogranulatus]|nr:hypothetical protein NMY22_g5926 [Coprinellus aureogranulatus]